LLLLLLLLLVLLPSCFDPSSFLFSYPVLTFMKWRQMPVGPEETLTHLV
jgi:hypothetical protein